MVVFVHGLWMTGAESLILRRRLAPHGYLLRAFRYSSVGESMRHVAARCAQFAVALAARHAVPVHFVGHSLGGLLIHRMFEQGECERAGLEVVQTRVVFLGTPVVPSRSAARLGSTRLGRWMMGAAAAAELLHPATRVWHFAPPLGLIAGSSAKGMGRLLVRMQDENDGTVEVAETRLAGASAHIVLPTTHSGLVISKPVAEAVIRFLDTGAF